MIKKWFDWLDMPKYDEKWHQDDMADELAEYKEAKGFINRISEASDVVYTYERAKWSGHDSVKFPLSKKVYYTGILYGAGKYTLRFWFFKHAGKKAGATDTVRSVRNPKKTHKLHAIAEESGIDPIKFQTICESQLKYWPLLP